MYMKKRGDTIEYQVGRDIKHHLVQPFLVKALSRQDGPAPCPADLKLSNVGESTTSRVRLFQWLIVPIVKSFLLVCN